MSNSLAIGVAYSDQNIRGADYLYATDEIGYTSDAAGTVTQATSKSTGVTLNKSVGQITLNNAALAAATGANFTLTNSKISTKDAIILSIVSGAATAGTYTAWVTGLAAGSATITVRNISAGSLSEALVINYVVIHAE